MTKAELLARIAVLESENTAFAAELGVARVEKLRTRATTFKYMTARVKHDGGMQPFTPTAVDMIRKYYWRWNETKSRADMIAALISQGFTPATVRTRISRLIAGIDESCYNDEIRARLGLAESEEA